ncbi:Chromate transport protein [Anaerovibrio sp. JC8]|uniref:chromate transporter n=1 Tax=Anaerovibrio sp. JC8 TaxID=1240085 RepID=UPI000A0C82AB|nr:chromate transporter [Anaerovibrio sp. JC8]ORT99779.1 Chromate transport protein [Anaerovibrio sp. JC8]
MEEENKMLEEAAGKLNIVPGTRHFYWVLFKSTFLISAFTVGGGMVIIPLLKKKFVDEYGWINDKDTLDITAIAQSLPGIMAVNASIMLGYKMSGLMGTMVTILATILPPLITITIIAFFYDLFAHNYYVQLILKGMQCGATAVIIDVGLNLVNKLFKKKLLLPILIAVGTFVASLCFNVNPMYCVLVDAIIGLLLLRDPKYN